MWNARTAVRSLKFSAAAVSIEYNLPVLARIPIDPKLANAVDQGKIEEFEQDWMKAAVDKIEEF